MDNPRPGRTGPRDSVAIGFVGGIIAGLARHGIDPDALLGHAGIATPLPDDPLARVPVARYASLYRLINDRLDDEGFGLFSRPLRRGSFEFLCRGAISFEWLLRMIHGVAAWLVAKPLALTDAAFPYPPPPHAAEYELVFAPRCAFAAPHLAAHFPAASLAWPVRRDEAALTQFLAGAPASITTLYRRDRALALRVREYLRAALPEQRALGEVARALALSPRTLHRRLTDEGTSLRAIRAALRRDLAIEWLAKSERPLCAIAADLGFAEPSAFYRAFAAWTGEGPRHYRQRLRE